MTDSIQQNKIIFPYYWASVRKSPDYNPLLTLSQNICSLPGLNAIYSPYPNQSRNGNLIDFMYAQKGITPCRFHFPTSKTFLIPLLIYSIKKIILQF
jgi:hypothetical protein